MNSQKNKKLFSLMKNEEDWNNWKTQYRLSAKTESQLSQWLNLSDDERLAIKKCEGKYKISVTPYYASLMDPDDDSCPIRRQALPSTKEFVSYPGAEVDPVGDTFYRKTKRVVHKYPNRVIFLVSDTCPVYCRHCTRKFHTTDVNGTYYAEGVERSYAEDFEYLESHPEIDDVLLTGGDPLTLGDQHLEKIISRLRDIPHINIIRIGSRFPVFLPQRITPEFCKMLSRYHPVWLNTHFNHPKEITPEAAQSVDLLLRHGIPVQNQSVLLKGVNDDPEIMRSLSKQLLGIRVRPYYLYHCDNVTGVSHFQTSIGVGKEILQKLTGYETGFSVPQYVVTTKIGKLPISNNYVEEDGNTLRGTNYRNEKLEFINVGGCDDNT